MKWTSEQIKKLKEKYIYYYCNRQIAESIFQRKWNAIQARISLLKLIIPTKMKRINKKCSVFLGCHIAERTLSYVFKDVKRMSLHNHGYDFICNKGYKIDVKASCIRTKQNYYSFNINYNKIADYFLLIGFDNRENLNPQHIWLIKSDEVIRYKVTNYIEINNIHTISIKNNPEDLNLFSKYELTDKLKETIDCCNKLKNEESK